MNKKGFCTSCITFVKIIAGTRVAQAYPIPQTQPNSRATTSFLDITKIIQFLFWAIIYDTLSFLQKKQTLKCLFVIIKMATISSHIISPYCVLIYLKYIAHLYQYTQSEIAQHFKALLGERFKTQQLSISKLIFSAERGHSISRRRLDAKLISFNEINYSYLQKSITKNLITSQTTQNHH